MNFATYLYYNISNYEWLFKHLDKKILVYALGKILNELDDKWIKKYIKILRSELKKDLL